MPLALCFSGVIAFACCLGASPPAVAQDLRAEQAQLLEQSRRQPTDHTTTFRYATVSAELGDYEAAIGALERLLMFNPRLARARFELGILYLRLGATETAASHLRAARADPGLAPAQQAQIDALMPDLEKHAGASRFFGKLQAGLRYQSNASFQPDNGIFRSFGFDILSPAPNKSDLNSFQLAEIGHDYDLGTPHGDKLETRVAGYATQQFRRDEFNLGLISFSFGPRFAIAPESWQGATIKPYVTGLASTLGSSNYVSAVGGGVSLRLPFGQTVSIEPGIEWRRLDVRDRSLAPTIVLLSSGDVVTPSLAGIVKLNDFATLEMRARYVRARGATPAQSFHQTGADAMLRLEFDPPFMSIGRKWTIAPFGGVSQTSFDAPNPILDPVLRRRDQTWRTGVAFEAPVTPMFGFAGFVEYARNASSLPNFRTSNLSVMFGPTVRF